MGLLIGVGYGLLAGALIVFLEGRQPDAPFPGPLIPDANEWRRLVAHVLAAVVALSGALVGMTVGLASAGKLVRAGVTGFGVGLAALAAGGLAAASVREWLALPAGLALTGVVAASATGWVARRRNGARGGEGV